MSSLSQREFLSVGISLSLPFGVLAFCRYLLRHCGRGAAAVDGAPLGGFFIGARFVESPPPPPLLLLLLLLLRLRRGAVLFLSVAA